MTKKLLVSAISVVLFLSLSAHPSYALQLPFGGLKKELHREIQDDKKEIKNDRQDLRNDVKNLKDDVKDLKKLGRGAKILNGEVKSKDGSNLTVEKDGKTYTVQTDSNTKFKRHFWGSSSLNEVLVGDKVNIYGKFTDDAQTTILAAMIRDISIMKRFGAFVGTVADLSGSTFTLNTVARGAQKVTLDGNTKCVNRKEETINCTSNIQNSHRVRVKGMWDKANNTITQISHLKDYSLPPVPTPTP